MADVSLVSTRDEPRLLESVRSVLDGAEEALLCVAFVDNQGVNLLEDQLRGLGKSARLLTTTTFGATKASALDVGSSNLSRSALTDGIEWNVRVAAVDLPHVVEKFEAVFRRYWDDKSAGFVAYTGVDAERTRLRDALARARGGRAGELANLDQARVLEVEPRDFQRTILDDLDAARRHRGQRRNLVVAATGTGKTVVAGFDYKRLRAEATSGVDSLLFVAHREDILKQSRRVFREVLGRPDFGELFVAGERPLEGRHVFASIQSLASVMARSPPRPDAFSMVVVDEVHHAAADTYRKLLDHVEPAILLGLTATPERADDDLGSAALKIEDYFPRPWASELRVWDAIDRQILVPFGYFAIDDGTDLSGVAWTRGRYSPSALSALYAGNVVDGHLVWVQRVARAIGRYVRDASDMRALAFCVDKAHAVLTARALEAELQVRCVAVTSDDRYEVRRAHLDALVGNAPDRPRVLCVVDLLNEGVDLPGVDTILLLRPTESATLFVQQIGRGLRRAPQKDTLTVLDCVGVQHERFRFEARYKGLLGLGRGELKAALDDGVFRLPSGCVVQFEERPREQVLKSLRRSLRIVRDQLHERLDRTQDAELSLGAFLSREGLELEDVYRDGRTWASLRAAAGLAGPSPADELEKEALERLARFLHVDDRWRLDVLDALARGDAWAPADERERRLAQMLGLVIYGLERGSELGACLERLRAHALLRAELRELSPVLRARSRVVPSRAESQELARDVPLHVHGRYLTEEILAAFDKRSQKGAFYVPGKGVVPHERFDFLLVTLDKSGKSKLPHLQYEDYALAPDLFHWQSQAKTTADSSPGKRHLSPDVVPLLFVREASKDERGLATAYRFLGATRLVEQRGERPMSIVYKLVDGPMPADLLARTRVAVA